MITRGVACTDACRPAALLSGTATMADPDPAHNPGAVDRAGRDRVHRLLLEHQVMLGGFLFMLCEDWDAAEEALQETAGFICTRWRDFRPGTDFRAWARAIARNLLKETLRKRSRARRDAERARLAAMDRAAGPVDEAEWESASGCARGERDALAHCLDQLPADVRRLVDLRYTDRWSCQRIAERLGRSLEAVYKTLSRVRFQLRDCIEARVRGGTAP
jgi:RNA polymerase sigma-70 factor (ECF subfamily)